MLRKLLKTFLKCNDGEIMPLKKKKKVPFFLFFSPHDVLFLDKEKKAWAMSVKLDICYAPGKEAF